MIRVRWPFYAFLALAPLALLAGFLLQIRNARLDSPLDFRVATDRAQAIRGARSYLAALGVDTQGWNAYCGAAPDQDLFRYLRRQPAAERDYADRIVPFVRVNVLFQSKDGARRASLALSLRNQVLAYDIHAAGEPGDGSPASAETSLGVAQAVLSGDPELSRLFASARPEIATVERSGDLVTRRYTWRSPVRNMHELEAQFSVTVRADRVVGRSLNTTVDPDYAARNLHGGETALALFGMAYLLFAATVAVYSLVSYGRRATQNEVSHARTLWMALLVSILFIGVFYTGSDQSVLQNGKMDSGRQMMGFILTLISAVALGGGLLVGIAYGSGEGAVREAYPGKLTSLDALILGKVFSRNVGGSVVVGVIFASWLLLLSQLLVAPLAGRQSLYSLSFIEFVFLRNPWLSMLMVQPAIALLFVIGGLLQPLAFVTRSVRVRWARIVLLILFAAMGASAAVTSRSSLSGVLTAILICVPALLIPFFAYDLLASLVCLVTLLLAGALANLVAIYQGWTGFAAWMAALAATLVMVEFVAWRKGRLWRDEEVRPEYGRHIAERQALQEEVLAAREAQLRLLPQAPPEVAGLSIFASCLPARVVGGDFYDFFTLPDGRLGIFIAEGGNRGLASALLIALAKGYLMYTVRRPYSPTEVILRLESTLGPLIEGRIVTTTLAYAVIDVRKGMLIYARTGTYPKIIVARGTAAASQLEREVSIVNATRKTPIWEGQAALTEGDSIVMYTDGIARRLSSRSSMLQEDWIRRLAQEQPDAQSLHLTLLDAIGAGEKAHEREDDLTAIVIRRTRTEAALVEVVA